MLIRCLTLEDVKSYQNTVIEFTPGTNAIVGRNGSGKTTILEAIGFALFDYLPYSQADFVREGQKSARVTVDFLSGHDERTYQVVRRCGSSAGYTIMDPDLGLKICEGKADVSQFLRQHLGVDPATDLSELFKNAVGVPQGSFTAAFLESPTSRKSIFDPLLRVAEYRKAFENLREPLSLLSDRRNQQEIIISGLEGALARLPALQSEAQELTGRINAAEQQQQAAQASLAVAETERQRLEEQREQLLEMRRTVELHRQAVSTQEQLLASASQRLAATEKSVALAEENRPGHEAYQRALQEQRQLQTRMAERRKLQEERSEIDKRLILAETHRDSQNQALAAILQAEQTAAALLDEVKQQENLENQLRDAQRRSDRLQDATAAVQRQQAAVAGLRERQARLETDLARAQEIEAALAPLQERLDALQDTVSTQRNRAAQLDAESNTINEQVSRLQAVETAICPVCEQPLTEEHRTSLLERNQQRLYVMAEERHTAAQAIQQAETEQKTARKALSQHEQALRTLPRPQELDEVGAELSVCQEQLVEAQELAESLRDAAGQVESIQQALTALSDPRRRREVALQQAAERPDVEASLSRLEEVLAQERAALITLDQKLAAYADVDATEARIRADLDEFQTADDLFRRNQAAVEALARHQQEVSTAQDGLQSAQKLLQTSQEQLKVVESEFDEQMYRAAVERVDAGRSQIVRLSTDIEHWRERLATVEADAASLQSQMAQLQAARSRHEQFTRQSELLQFIRSILREAGPFVTKALVQQISFAANQLFGEIMEDHTRILHWQEDYGIVLEVNGRERAFSQLSGGEQMTAALAVRLALLQEMSDIAVAFFDEPTTNLDEARRGSLARQILSIQGFQQMFVISHDDTFEQATETLIRVEKENGVSSLRDNG